jgi:hypothetical protein
VVGGEGDERKNNATGSDRGGEVVAINERERNSVWGKWEVQRENGNGVERGWEAGRAINER